MSNEVKVHGLEELVRKLGELPKVLRRRVLRNALAAGARVVRDEAKRKAPVLGNPMKAPYRKPGTVRDAIRVRTSKADRKAGNVGVFVNVKPASKADRGTKSRNDPYYWQWLEFGRSARAGRPMRAPIKSARGRRSSRAVGYIRPFGFLAAGARKLPDAVPVIVAALAKWIAKVNASGKVE